jgi:hypothetical protein
MRTMTEQNAIQDNTPAFTLNVKSQLSSTVGKIQTFMKMRAITPTMMHGGWESQCEYDCQCGPEYECQYTCQYEYKCERGHESQRRIESDRVEFEYLMNLSASEFACNEHCQPTIHFQERKLWRP